MPWETRNDPETCSASKPWAVVNLDSGETEGCHETEVDAEAQRRALYASEGEDEMKHSTVLVKKAVTTDQGTFTALAATYSIDRTKERIIPGAFEKTIKAWRESGKNIPLHWDHSDSAHDVIGYIDPASMRETKDGLYVEGRLDLEDSAVAKEAWRSMKNNTIALSFGYLFESREGKDGVKELVEIDLFEITLTPAPVNAETRILSLKSVASVPGWVERLKKIPEMDDGAIKQFLEDAEQIKGYIAEERAEGRTLRSQSNELALAAALGWPNEAQAKASGISPEELKRNRDILTFADEHPKLDVLSVLKTVVDLDLAMVKAWSAAFNDLPDSSFLYVEPGKKGDEGTRYFPYKDANGTVDLPHLRNALARISQSNLSQEIKDRLTAKAQRLLENAEKALSSVTDNPKGQKSDDSLRKRTFDLALEMAGGRDVRYEEPVPGPEPEPLDEVALRRKSDELALQIALG